LTGIPALNPQPLPTVTGDQAQKYSIQFRDLTTAATPDVIYSGAAAFSADSVIIEPPYNYALKASVLYHVTVNLITGGDNGFTLAHTTNPKVGKL
jgi:hypothetical protein